MNWIIENKEWLFSGAGIALILRLFKYVLENRKKSNDSEKTTQIVGKDIHAGGNVIIRDVKQEIKS